MFARTGLRFLRTHAAALGAGTASAAAAGYAPTARAECAPGVGLDPDGWVKLKLHKVEKLTGNTAIYRFAYEDPKATSGMTVASCLLTKANIGKEKPDGSRGAILRPYTPISRPEVAGYLDLAVKAYPEGKMSKHIASLQVGDTLDFKGPIVKLAYKANEYKEIGMIAGGTGLTPMLQVIDEILANPEDKTQVSLIYGSLSEDDIMMKAEVDKRIAANPNRLKVFYVVDKKSSMFWRGGVGYITEPMIKEHMPPPSQDSMIYVCGPPPMYKAICGPKGTKEDPKAQGDLGGLLQQIGYEAAHVFKF